MMLKLPFLLLTLAAAFAMAVPAMAESAPFRFEDYKEKTAFIEAVTTRFPVGSSYLEFKRQIIRAGGKAGQNMLNPHSDSHLYLKDEKPSVGKMILTSWSIAITADGDIIQSISPTLKFAPGQ